MGGHPLLSSLMNDAAFLGSQVLPLVEETAEDWYVAHRHDSPDGSYSLQIFVWPPGSRTRIHDYSSWGGFFCAVGSVLEERYERLGDGSVPDHARLNELWRVEGEGKTGSRPFCRTRGAFTGLVTQPSSRPFRCTCTVRGSGR